MEQEADKSDGAPSCSKPRGPNRTFCSSAVARQTVWRLDLQTFESIQLDLAVDQPAGKSMRPSSSCQAACTAYGPAKEAWPAKYSSHRKSCAARKTLALANRLLQSTSSGEVPGTMAALETEDLLSMVSESQKISNIRIAGGFHPPSFASTPDSRLHFVQSTRSLKQLSF